MATRRAFMQKALGGSAALAAYGLFPSSRVLGANDRIRIGLIGAGGAGRKSSRRRLKCPNVEGVAAADIYTRRLDEVESDHPLDPNLPRFSQTARRQEHRRSSDCHASAPARAEFCSGHSGGKGRLPGKDHGVQSRPRQAHAQSAGGFRTRRAGGYPIHQFTGCRAGARIPAARAHWA